MPAPRGARPKDVPVTVTATTLTAGRRTRTECLRITGIVGAVAALHVVGRTLYLYYAHGQAGPESL
jgi:high-affinity nickel-transport protein